MTDHIEECPRCKEMPDGVCFHHAPMPRSVHLPECAKSVHCREEVKKGPGEITHSHIECTCGVSKAWEDYHEDDEDEEDIYDAVQAHRLANGFYDKPPRLSFIFAWYDLWVGVFWDRREKNLYVFPVPMFGFVIRFDRGD